MTFRVKSCYIKDEEGEELVCYGYRHNCFKIFIFYLLCLCSGGFLLLVAYWKPDWALRMKGSVCSLHKAKYVLLKTTFDTWFVEEIETRYCGHKTRYGTSMQDSPNKQDANSINSALEAGLEKQCLMTPTCDFLEEFSIRLFMHRHLQYTWNSDTQTFQLLRALDEKTTPTALYGMCRGLTAEEAAERYALYGPNIIDVNVKSYPRLFFEEAADPFYVFQVFSVVLWFVELYCYYAAAIFFISLGSILISINQTRKHLITLRNMVAFSEKVTVLRGNGVRDDVSSECLVPGDVLLIPAGGMMMPCDAALVSGNCIVNESMLTGESVPVTKTPLPRESKDGVVSEQKEPYYKPEVHKRHTLFNGTKIIQTRYYGDARVQAIVVRTGFSTTKGGLIRSILSPRPVGFKFFRDSMRFIGLLGVLAAAGFAYSVYVLNRYQMSAGDTVLNALDVITIAVPPALPAAMSVGIVYAVQRLKKHSIYCINPSRINMCGKLKLFCFDKTGTLTEDGLDILGVVPVEDASFRGIVREVKYLPQGPLLAAMATCHSLTVIDGQLSGDPLDLKMFEATDWVLEEPGEDVSKFDSIVPTTVKPKNSGVFNPDSAMEGTTPYEIAIVRQFPFSSDIQRMSVITRTLGAHRMDSYVKGAPETIVSLCDADTVPLNFQEELQEYTRRGYRVLGLAWGPLTKLSWHQAQRINRDRVERNLTFLGLLILQNALKIETAPVINNLHNADIRTVMVTGDNMLTAISVARECGMVKPHQKVVLVGVKSGEEVPGELQLSWSVVGEVNSGVDETKSLAWGSYHLATPGKVYSMIRNTMPELLERLLVSGTIFARMSPEQKTHLVEDLQKIGYCVGMCGDGANDCGALKAAHAGISLSEAEASVASPFTSKIPNIECVPTVIREGRAALVTSFGVFKYMALYSIVQFVSVLILYSMSSNLGDFQFLYIDLVLITSLALVMGRTAAYPRLVPQRPGGSLLSPVVVFSLLSQISIQVLVQLAGIYYVRQQPWYRPVNSTSTIEITCHDNVVLFSLSSFQYILLAVVFAQGVPYRVPFYYNIYFLAVLVLLTVVSSFLTVLPGKVIQSFFQLAPMPDLYFRLTLLGIAACNLLFSYFVEQYIAHSRWLKQCLNRLRCKTQPKNFYKKVQHQLGTRDDWPPVS